MPSPHAQRAAIARAVRDGHHEEAERLRASYFTESLATRIRTAVAKAQLSPEQVAYLCALLQAGEGGR